MLCLNCYYHRSSDIVRFMRIVRIHVWGHYRLLPNPNALLAFSKGMRAVKLCTKKICQFLTAVPGDAGRPV